MDPKPEVNKFNNTFALWSLVATMILAAVAYIAIKGFSVFRNPWVIFMALAVPFIIINFIVRKRFRTVSPEAQQTILKQQRRSRVVLIMGLAVALALGSHNLLAGGAMILILAASLYLEKRRQYSNTDSNQY